MQKYRADKATQQPDGAVVWHTVWMGGPTLAKIQNCRIHDSELRRTVYITGEPDTFFSQPAATRVRGKYIAGFITTDDAGYIFHAMDKHRARISA